jgi:hypothetical protein
MHDFLAKLIAQLLLSVAVRIIETLWRGPRAEEIIHALGERLVSSGPWAAARSALGSVRALAGGSRRVAVAVVYACGMQIGATLVARSTHRLPHDLISLIHPSGLIPNVVGAAGVFLTMEVALLMAGVGSRLVSDVEIRFGTSIAWPSAFLALSAWGTLSFAFHPAGVHVTVFSTLLVSFILCFSVTMAMSSHRPVGFAEHFATRLLDRRARADSDAP